MNHQDPPPICSGCGNALLLKNLPMKEYNRIQRITNDVRKCVKCGYIKDVGIAILENELYTIYHLLGADPLGRFISAENKWIQD